MTKLVLGLIFVCAGCAVRQEAPAPVSAPSKPRATIEVTHSRAALERQKHHEAGRERAPDTDQCQATRPYRVQEMGRRLASIEHKNELVDWENDHCRLEDRSKAVVRVYQDHTGEYHLIEGRDRPVDMICDAKPPEEIKTQAASSIPLYNMPVDVHFAAATCRDLDLADPTSADVALSYWEQSCIEQSRNGKTAPPARSSIRKMKKAPAPRYRGFSFRGAWWRTFSSGHAIPIEGS